VTAKAIPTDEAYTEWSTTYDSDCNPTRELAEVVTRETLAELRCGTVIEIGCGTGINTSFLATIGQNVRALDFSPGMLDRARQNVQSDRVTFVRADLTQRWPCPDQSGDLIVCALVLEHIQDLDFIYSETSRVLRPRGELFICELHPFRQYYGACAMFQRGTETTRIKSFVHHKSEFLDAARNHGLLLVKAKEWWHPADQGADLPRLVSFMFQKKENGAPVEERAFRTSVKLIG
jgi:malonyl-CoA O-methyltransferase